MRTASTGLILILTFCSTLTLIGQNAFIFQDPLKAECISKIKRGLEEGKIVEIEKLEYVYSQETGKSTLYLVGNDPSGARVLIEPEKIGRLKFSTPNDRESAWELHQLLSGTCVSLVENGVQYGERRELHNNAVTYINSLEDQAYFFKDPYLEDYLYSILNQIHGSFPGNDRPGNIYIKVLKQSQPNAFSLPNGCVLITTGMLSTIQSESELVGILAHEVAHFILDHHMVNYNAAADRAKKAAIIAGIATALAAGTEIYLASTGNNYAPGILTQSVAIASVVFADAILENLGVRFDREQERQADRLSQDMLKILDHDDAGLSIALERLKLYLSLTGNYQALSGSGSHPSIDDRIKELKTKVLSQSNSKSLADPKYLRTISLVTSFNAQIELWHNANFQAASNLAQRNISNEVATEVDYVIQAIVKRRLENSEASNLEVLALLTEAKKLNVNPISIIDRELGITYLRLNQLESAKGAFNEYSVFLQNRLKAIDRLEYPSAFINVNEDLIWTRMMIYKARSF
jgi:beta-barrel assembly-enhancing protease